MVPFDVGYRRGERSSVGSGRLLNFCRPDVVARREVPRLDESARAVSFDFTDKFGEHFGRSRAGDEVDVVGEYVARHDRNAVLAARLDDSLGDELLVVGAKYDRLARFNVEGRHPARRRGRCASRTLRATTS